MPSNLELIHEKITACRRCWLGDAHSGPVPYSGPESPQILVVGEAPGPEEDERGEPFVGRAGGYLKNQLRKSQIPVKLVGFCNVASCYPGKKKNGQFRPPKKEEQQACRTNLLFQMRLLKAPLVLLAGKTALQAFRPDWLVSKERGRPLAMDVGYGPFLALPTYHPSAVVRTSQLRQPFANDLLQLKWRLKAENMWERWPETCRLCGGEVACYGPDGACYCERHAIASDKDYLIDEGFGTNQLELA